MKCRGLRAQGSHSRAEVLPTYVYQSTISVMRCNMFNFAPFIGSIVQKTIQKGQKGGIVTWKASPFQKNVDAVKLWNKTLWEFRVFFVCLIILFFVLFLFLFFVFALFCFVLICFVLFLFCKFLCFFVLFYFVLFFVLCLFCLFFVFVFVLFCFVFWYVSHVATDSHGVTGNNINK